MRKNRLELYSYLRKDFTYPPVEENLELPYLVEVSD